MTSRNQKTELDPDQVEKIEWEWQLCSSGKYLAIASITLGSHEYSARDVWTVADFIHSCRLANSTWGTHCQIEIGDYALAAEVMDQCLLEDITCPTCAAWLASWHLARLDK